MPENTTPATSAPRISRRTFIIGGSLFTLGLGAVAGALILQPTLRALVDTIIPADEFGPAASETGAVAAIRASLEGRLPRQIGLRAALAWLNFRAGGSFASASPEMRQGLLNELASRPAGDTRRRFYDWLRDQTLLHYYASAERAKSLGFVGAPQPEGYPEAWGPWKPDYRV